MNYKGYPTIIVHGFFGWGDSDFINKVAPYFGGYWGAGDKGIDKYLMSQGYEAYCPSVGPWNSSWDRSCELYAIIKGGTVDYGKVHSEKYHHARYGRTYPGLIKDWGEPGQHAKINIIGHSFGGPTVCRFTSLMEAGSEEERAGTPAEELSPLFAGGHGNLVHTATTLSGTNNGTTMASFARNKIGDLVNWLLLGVLSTTFGDTPVMKFWDMKMDRFGISKDPKDITGWHLRKPTACREGVEAYIANDEDNIMREMSVETQAEINKQLTISPHMYYFAHCACRSKKIGNTNIQLMELKSFPIAHISALVTGWFNSPSLKKNFGVNADWFASDGPVNTICCRGPFVGKAQPAVDWKDGMEIKPGVWHNMPVEHKDHFSWMGYLEKKQTYYDDFRAMVERANSLPDAD